MPLTYAPCVLPRPFACGACAPAANARHLRTCHTASRALKLLAEALLGFIDSDRNGKIEVCQMGSAYMCVREGRRGGRAAILDPSSRLVSLVRSANPCNGDLDM